MFQYTSVCIVTLAVAASAFSQHSGDINPVVVPDREGGWRIQTNYFAAGGSISEDVRVFASLFGDSGFPEFTSNPGFDAAPGTFTPGTRVGFNAPEGFFRFTGDGLESVVTEYLNVKFLTEEVDVGPLPTPGFDLAVQANGGWHRHFSFTLKDDVESLPAPGIYVLPMTLYSTDPEIGESELFYIVYDYQAGAAAQEEAMEWITHHLLREEEHEEHFDIWIRVEYDRIVTGAISEGAPGEPIAERARVFGAELGEDPKFPFASFEPGFQALAGPETAGAVLGFSIVGPVEVWTGGGFGSTEASMTIAFGPASVESSSGEVEGFSFSLTESGLFHEHFDFHLNGPKGADPQQGVYLLPLRLHGVAPAYEESRTFWIIFNNGEEEEVHEAAIEYAEQYLVCAADLNDDGTVDGADLGRLLAAWGSGAGDADLDGNGVVNGADLGLLLSAWGGCGGAR